MPVIEQNLTNVNYNSRGTNPSWIVIHNTANGTSTPPIAYNNTQYFKNVNRSASATFFIDNGDTIWQCVRETDTAWHCGEAASRNGCHNYNSIGIEVCEGSDGRFTETEINNLTWLVRTLMQRYGIPASRVCRHHDVTGKNCPWFYSDDNEWRALWARITGGSYTAPTHAVEISGDVDTLARKVINGEFGNGDARKAALGDRYAEVQARVNELLSGKTVTEVQHETFDIDKAAHDVINGKYGNGDARRQALGDNYIAVQRRVNEILMGTPTPTYSVKKSIETLAWEVINGEWGNGSTRQYRLESEGYDYNAVQRRVNEILL